MAGRLATELRQRTDEQLHSDLENAHQELFTLRFQAATRQLADVSKIRKTRRQIARLRTLLGERARTAGPPAADEAAVAGELIASQSLADFTHVMLNLNEFLYLR